MQINRLISWMGIIILIATLIGLLFKSFIGLWLITLVPLTGTLIVLTEQPLTSIFWKNSEPTKFTISLVGTLIVGVLIVIDNQATGVADTLLKLVIAPIILILSPLVILLAIGIGPLYFFAHSFLGLSSTFATIIATPLGIIIAAMAWNQGANLIGLHDPDSIA